MDVKMTEELTQYRISTITATGSVNSEIDLDVFYDNLRLVDNDDVGKSGIVYAEYGKKKSETQTKGYSKKHSSRKARSSNAHAKRFDNQVTIVYRMVDKDMFSPKNALNTKVFRNGNIQITGIKYIEQGRKMIDIIIDMLLEMYESGHANVVVSKEKMENTDYSIRLINSDFKVGFPIKRENLYKVFTSMYDNDCSFEPCIYPGVKIRYYYNECNVQHDGLCHCDEYCSIGKGSGKANGQCKKITVAVFQSGCVIITGAQSQEQINDAYNFIVKVIMENRIHIEKKTVVPPIALPVLHPGGKKYLINKRNIIYPPHWSDDNK